MIDISVSSFVTVISLILAILGFYFSWKQYRARIEVQRLQKDLTLTFLNTVSKHVPSSDYLKKLLGSNNRDEVAMWVWKKHQVLCDMYRSVVSQYLQTEPSFGWEDLQKFVLNRTIGSSWQEQVWRDIVIGRKSNKDKDVPDRFVK